MSITVAAVALAVRDQDVRFSVRAVDPAALVRFLSDYQRKLFAKALLRNRRFQAQTQTVTLPLLDFEAGVVLTPYARLVGGSFENGEATLPLWLTSYEDRFTPRRFPAAYEHGGSLFLLGPPSAWSSGAVRIDSTPILADLTDEQSTFTLPDHAKGALVSAAAAFAARKVGVVAEEIGPWMAAAKDEEARFLDEISQAGG